MWDRNKIMSKIVSPYDIGKGVNEHSQQKAFFAWLAIARNIGIVNALEMPSEPELIQEFMVACKANCQPAYYLDWVHAIPNGGMRGDTEHSRQISGGIMKAEGVKSGVADVFVPIPADGINGLYMEFKRPSLKPKNYDGLAGLDKNQVKFKKHAMSFGYGYLICYTWLEAVNGLSDYILQRRRQ